MKSGTLAFLPNRWSRHHQWIIEYIKIDCHRTKGIIMVTYPVPEAPKLGIFFLLQTPRLRWIEVSLRIGSLEPNCLEFLSSMGKLFGTERLDPCFSPRSRSTSIPPLISLAPHFYLFFSLSLSTAHVHQACATSFWDSRIFSWKRISGNASRFLGMKSSFSVGRNPFFHALLDHCPVTEGFRSMEHETKKTRTRRQPQLDLLSWGLSFLAVDVFVADRKVEEFENIKEKHGISEPGKEFSSPSTINLLYSPRFPVFPRA